MALQTQQSSERATKFDARLGNRRASSLRICGTADFKSALHAGFTLIELMLVMAILTVAVAIAAPALSRFFRGRSLESQARMLVALTRHAQSRAASEGLPMDLWVDTQKSEVGLEAEPSYDQVDPKAMNFPLENNARIEVMNVGSTSANTLGTSKTTTTSSSKVMSRHPGIPRIRFMPDGTLDDESPMLFKLTGNEGDVLFIAQTRSRMSYEVRTTN
jgi:type II secretion system protein H